MKKRKGDVALQQSIINIALLIVAVLMILLAVWFVRNALSKNESLGQKATFDKFIQQLKGIEKTWPSDKTKVSSSVILQIDKGFRIYGFSEADAGVKKLERGVDIPEPPECGPIAGARCFCICNDENDPKKIKCLDCRIMDESNVNEYLSVPGMYNNIGWRSGEEDEDGNKYEYFALKGDGWRVRTVWFTFERLDDGRKRLIFSDKRVS
ncbi:MAG: hypothetical protein V1702_05855 [Candidatus Woesearchaeota archaeon]